MNPTIKGTQFVKEWVPNFDNQTAWDDLSLSDVSNFDKNNFKLTVIAASPHYVRKVMRDIRTLTHKINSASLISHDVRRTYASIEGGFVVQIPPKAIMCAYPKDTYTENYSANPTSQDPSVKKMVMKERNRLNYKFGIMTPDLVLKGSSSKEPNEIAFLGNTAILEELNPEEVQITALYIKTTSDKLNRLREETSIVGSDLTSRPSKAVKKTLKNKKIKPANDKLRLCYATLKEFAAAKNIPLIEISVNYCG